MIMYKLQNDRLGNLTAIGIVGTGWSIPLNPELPEYQQYLAWLAEGNTPEPAEEQQ